MAPWFDLITKIFAYVMAALAVYSGVFIVFALRVPKAPPTAAPRHRFALVIAARNEEQVIGHLLDSLYAQDYPAALFDVFVIADNCTDATARICAERGARVYERQNQRQLGKGYALGWFFNQIFIPKFGEAYDAIGIFDADNLADSGFLPVMNDYLCAGETSVVGYREAKNPHDNWISAGSALFFWTKIRIYDLPRTKLGLSALAGGTGFVFRTSLIADGWNTTTLVEDTQFTMQLNARGTRIAQAREAVFYDEQPNKFGVLTRQHLRWATGNYQNFLACSPLLLKGLFSRRPLLSLDGLIFLLLQPLLAINIGVQIVRFGFQAYHQPQALLGIGLTVFIGLMVCILQGLFVLLIEKKFCFRAFKHLFLYPFFLCVIGVMMVFSLFNFRPSWRPIHHKRNVSLKEITTGRAPRKVSKIG